LIKLLTAKEIVLTFKNVPNILTIGRIILIPGFVVVLMLGHYYIAAVIFIIASLTDALDGFIARKYDATSNFGKLMDPLADKILVLSALVCLVELGDIPGWMVIVMLTREFLITGLRAIAARDGLVIAADLSGKIKTVFQMLAIIAILFQNQPFERFGLPVSLILLWIALILTVYSGVEYIIKNRKLFR
jgi:CDP-diacylglycerol--glycerol-3-phosphate 3-phosphatidyltransferase